MMRRKDFNMTRVYKLKLSTEAEVMSHPGPAQASKYLPMSI